jgi:multimeric flavodoxin WrbA
MPNAIAMFSSSRRNGNTGQLLDRIAKELDIEIVDFDQIVFATPVCWYAVSPARHDTEAAAFVQLLRSDRAS